MHLRNFTAAAGHASWFDISHNTLYAINEIHIRGNQISTGHGSILNKRTFGYLRFRAFCLTDLGSPGGEGNVRKWASKAQIPSMIS